MDALRDAASFAGERLEQVEEDLFGGPSLPPIGSAEKSPARQLWRDKDPAVPAQFDGLVAWRIIRFLAGQDAFVTFRRLRRREVQPGTKRRIPLHRAAIAGAAALPGA